MRRALVTKRRAMRRPAFFVVRGRFASASAGGTTLGAMEPTEPRDPQAGLPQMPSGVWETVERVEQAERPEYASWGSRAGALFIDNLVLAIPWILSVVFFIAADSAETDNRDAGSLWLL